MDDLNDSRSWAQAAGYYEELKVVVGMTTLGRELKALEFMNIFRPWLTWMTLVHELKSLDATNKFRLWLRWATIGRELKALVVMNN